MKKISTLLFCVFSIGISSTAQQNYTLIGLVQQQLVKINQGNAQTTNYLNLSNYPSVNTSKLTWSSADQCFYTIESIGGVYRGIGRISSAGVYTSMGLINIPGANIYMIEGLAYNRQDNQMYAAVSLNGGPSSGDYYSESLIRFTPSTMSGTFVGAFSHPIPAYEPDADNMYFDETGLLYYIDGMQVVAKLFEQEITFSQSPVFKVDVPYEVHVDMTIKGDDLYYGNHSQLKRYNILTNAFSIIGTLSPSSLYAGQTFRGLTWIPEECPQMNYLDEELQFCSGGGATLTPNLTGSWSYSWSNQETTSSIFIDRPGKYILTITDGNCVYKDTISVIEQVENHTTSWVASSCPGNDATIIINSQNATAYSFDNGATWTTNNVSTGLSLGGYTVISRTALGCTDTSYIQIDSTITLPLVVSSDTSICKYATANLSAHVPNAGGEVYTYHWSHTNNVTETTSITTDSTTRISVYATNHSGTCFSDTLEIIVSVQEPEWGNIAVSETECGESTGAIVLSAQGGNMEVGTWTMIGMGSQISNVYTDLSEGSYTFHYTNIDGCQSNDTTILVSVHTSTVADFTATPSFGVAPLPIDIQNLSHHADSFLWSINGVVYDTPFDGFIADTPGLYSIQLIAWKYNRQCADTTQMTVMVYDAVTIEIPNIFTPNNDGINDYFTITSNYPLIVDMQIYNRWGAIVYGKKDEILAGVNILWNGGNVTDGVYYYVIRLSIEGDTGNLQSSNNFIQEHHGFITVIK